MSTEAVNPLLSTSGTLRPVLRLALPVLAEQILHTGVSFTDTYLAGKVLGEERHLAAMNVMAYMLWLLPSMLGFVSIGATALVARFVGAHDMASARRVTGQALLSGMVLALALVMALWLLADPFVSLMRISDDAAALAQRYLYIMIPVLPLMMLEQVGVACLRGAGDTVTGLRAMIVVDVVDAVFSYCLATGVGPFPKLGWDGLAWGNVAGFFVGATMITTALYRGRGGLSLTRAGFRWNGDLQRRLWRVGLPGGIDVVAVVFCHMWFITIVNRLGDTFASAHAVAIKIEALAYMPGVAFQVAAATLAGQYLGAGDHRRATRAVLVACQLAVSVMSIAAVSFFVWPEALGQFFLKDQQIIELTAMLLRIVAFSIPALALHIVLTGALRGAGDTRWPLATTFIGLLGVRLPLAYVLSLPTDELPLPLRWIGGYDLGIAGAWYAMVADIIVRCLINVVRFLTGGWKRIEV